mgnify:CR=1 FL=1
MKLIVSYVRRHIRMFLAAIGFLSLEIFGDLMQPSYMARIVDGGVKGRDVGAILRCGAVMLAIAALGAVGAVMRNVYSSRTSQTVGREMRSDLYRKVQTLSFENIDRLQPPAIITRITNDVTQIQNFVNGSMRVMMKAPITCVGAIVLIVLQTPQQIPVLIGILCVSAVLIFCNTKLGYPRYGRMQRKLDRLNGVSREFLSSVRVVKAFGAERQEQEKFNRAAGDFAQAGVASDRVSAVFSPLINLTVNFGIVLLLWLSQAQTSRQIGRLMASVNYMTQVLFALGMVSNILNMAVRALASSGRVQEIFDEKPAQPLSADPQVFRPQGAVTFKDVSFAYAGTRRDAVSHVGFSVHPGETLGIIGPTGSGKSTLVSLVPRFYDAAGGRVLLDGHDVTRIAPETLHRAVAIVPQKALLFSGTIAENLRWGDDGASDREIRRAAEDACADGFVRGFPMGYGTDLGEGGVNLSGGQKQRLCLARALLRRPRVLILDDCTSALDAETEAQVLDNLRREAAGVTVLLISQRISTVMRADRILCLEDGCLRGCGTHRQLLETCPVYRDIDRSQIGGGSRDG